MQRRQLFKGSDNSDATSTSSCQKATFVPSYDSACSGTVRYSNACCLSDSLCQVAGESPMFLIAKLRCNQFSGRQQIMFCVLQALSLTVSNYIASVLISQEPNLSILCEGHWKANSRGGCTSHTMRFGVCEGRRPPRSSNLEVYSADKERAWTLFLSFLCKRSWSSVLCPSSILVLVVHLAAVRVIFVLISVFMYASFQATLLIPVLLLLILSVFQLV